MINSRSATRCAAVAAFALLGTDEAAVASKLASPIYGVTLPQGYRRWELVAPSRELKLGEVRAIVGNRAAITAYREGQLPFPDGTVLVKLAWTETASQDFDGAFVPGAATTVQVMVKNSRAYPATGGWGFGRFVNGRPVDAAQHRTCFACHAGRVKSRDYVFTRIAK